MEWEWSLGHADVVHFIGDALVPERLQHLRPMDKKDTWKLKGIADNPSHAISQEHMVAHFTLPDPQAKELAKFTPLERKGAVEFLFGIADSMLVLRSKL